MRTLHLVRHPRTTAAPGRCYGWSDFPLSDEGRSAAHALADSFASRSVDALYSSPLSRALETSRLIGRATGRDVTTLSELAEVNFGLFEGKTFEEIASTDPDTYRRWMSSPSRVRFPEGESHADLRVRAARALGVLTEQAGESVVVVSHAGPIRAIIAEAVGIDDDVVFRFDLLEGSVSVIEWRAGVACLRALNVGAAGGPR